MRLISVGLCLAGLAGCQSSGDGGWLAPVTEVFTSNTREELARDAFDVYDADKRRESIARLSTEDFGGEEPYVRMYRILLQDPDASVRAAATKALGFHGSAEDALLLVPLLEDTAGFVRWETTLSLQKLQHPETVTPLLKALAQDPEADVRMGAACALGQYPQRRVYDALVGVLDDSDFGVVEAAHDSLVTLTGYDFGQDASLWFLWAQKREGDLFTHQQTYLWQPYAKPAGFWSKMLFWKDPSPPAPQLPTGMSAYTESE